MGTTEDGAPPREGGGIKSFHPFTKRALGRLSPKQFLIWITPFSPSLSPLFLSSLPSPLVSPRLFPLIALCSTKFNGNAVFPLSRSYIPSPLHLHSIQGCSPAPSKLGSFSSFHFPCYLFLDINFSSIFTSSLLRPCTLLSFLRLHSVVNYGRIIVCMLKKTASRHWRLMCASVCPAMAALFKGGGGLQLMCSVRP